MDSLLILPAIGESEYAFTERRRRAGVGVGDDSRGYPLEESERVELVEQGFGGSKSAGWRLRQLIQDSVRHFVEAGIGHHARHEADRLCLVCLDDPSRADQI